MKIKILNIILILLLSGCAITGTTAIISTVVAGGVAVAGVTTSAVIVADDPRNTGTIINDNVIEHKVNVLAKKYANANINITCYNGVVLFTGQILSEQDKMDIYNQATTIPGVKNIYNYLTVRLVQGVTQSIKDDYLSFIINNKLFFTHNIHSDSIKVTTMHSVVYLMGFVTLAEAQQVTTLISKMNGVKKIISLFEYKSM